MPLVLVCYSGGKSLHDWYNVYAQQEERLENGFFREALTLGADRATWCRSQFVRLPEGCRENGIRQTCYFFDPGNAVRL